MAIEVDKKNADITGKKNADVTEVLIGGKVYSLSGADPEQMHRISAFLNRKISELKNVQGYGRMDPAYKNLLLDINLADEYFKISDEAERLKKELEAKESELYQARHDLVGQKLKLENALKQEEILEKRVTDWKEKYTEIEKSLDNMTKS